MNAQLELFDNDPPTEIESTALLGDTIILDVNGTRYRATVGLPTTNGRVRLNHVREEVQDEDFRGIHQRQKED